MMKRDDVLHQLESVINTLCDPRFDGLRVLGVVINMWNATSLPSVHICERDFRHLFAGHEVERQSEGRSVKMVITLNNMQMFCLADDPSCSRTKIVLDAA